MKPTNTSSADRTMSATIAAAEVTVLPQEIVACVFHNSAFANDVAKTHTAMILNQRSIYNVRSSL